MAGVLNESIGEPFRSRQSECPFLAKSRSSGSRGARRIRTVSLVSFCVCVCLLLVHVDSWPANTPSAASSSRPRQRGAGIPLSAHPSS